MGALHKTNYDEATAHLKRACGIDLPLQLTSQRWRTLSAWSILSPLVLLYRYSEQIHEKLRLYDMVEDGHKSHMSGTDLDFGYADDGKAHKAVHQVRVINDLLELGEALHAQSSKIQAFRVGFYFDNLVGNDNLAKLKKAEDKEAKFVELYEKKRWTSSMHLGLRYDFSDDIYKGDTTYGNGKYVLWGRETDATGSGAWKEIFKDMDGNLTKAECAKVATTTLADLGKLDGLVPGAPDPDQSTGCHLPY